MHLAVAALVVMTALVPSMTQAVGITLDPDAVAQVSAPVAVGMRDWPDGNLGIEHSASGYRFYGPAADGSIGRADGTLAQPTAFAGAVGLRIAGVPDGVRYAAGGPIYTNHANGMKLLFTHLERPGANGAFYATVGLASSIDGGLSWSHLGEIFDHHSRGACAGESADPGGAPYVLQKTGGQAYFYVYFRGDQQACGEYTALGVMRAPVARVVAAAQKGNVSRWQKYWNGRFSEPGLGGKSSDLWPAGAGSFYSMDVKRSGYRNSYVMIANRRAGSSPAVHWSLELLESRDGFHWSSPEFVRLTSTMTTGGPELWYPTAVGIGRDPNNLGRRFALYYVRGHRWSTAELIRATLTFRKPSRH